MKYSAAAMLCLLIVSATASATLYRWVDDDGKVHYSDSVPPSKAQLGHTELDTNGNHTKKVSAAKSEDQVKEEAWLDDLEKQLQIKQSQQKRKDTLLLNSYVSIDQFDEFYAERLQILREERKQFELLQGKLESELERLLKQYKASSSAGAKKRVQGFIDTNMENAEAYQGAIKQNVDEEANIREESRKLRKRFLYLKEKEEQAVAQAEKNP